MFEARGETGIKILEIDSVGTYWDHKKSRLWDVEHLIRRFRISSMPFFEAEYLVENAIPPEHIKHHDWEKVKERLDRGAKNRNYYKRVKSYVTKRKRADEKDNDMDTKKPRKYKRRTGEYRAVIRERLQGRLSREAEDSRMR